MIERRLARDNRWGLRLLAGVLWGCALLVSLTAWWFMNGRNPVLIGLVDERTVIVTAPLDGRLQDIVSVEGEHIGAGAILARYDARQFDQQAAGLEAERAAAQAVHRQQRQRLQATAQMRVQAWEADAHERRLLLVTEELASTRVRYQELLHDRHLQEVQAEQDRQELAVIDEELQRRQDLLERGLLGTDQLYALRRRRAVLGSALDQLPTIMASLDTIGQALAAQEAALNALAHVDPDQSDDARQAWRAAAAAQEEAELLLTDVQLAQELTRLDQAMALLSLTRRAAQVDAPVAGMVTRWLQPAGVYVRAGEPLVELSDSRPAQVTVLVDPSVARRLETGGAVTVVPLSARWQRHRGVISHIGHSVVPVDDRMRPYLGRLSAAVPVHVRFNGASDLIAGETVRVFLDQNL